MELFFQFMLLALGLVFLWKMGELSVQYALGFSTIYGIHQFSVGFFIFAISTGLPEISSAIVSSLNKVPELSVGDLMGSTLANVSLILGVIAIYAREIEVSSFLRKKLFKVIGLTALILVGLTFHKGNGLIMGIALTAIYLLSIFWFQGGLPKQDTSEEISEIEEKVRKKGFFSPKIDILLKLMGSLTVLLLASWVIVHSSVNISGSLGIDLTVLGGTLIAVGTSFPELALEIHAIKRKKYSLALGDLFGSSLLNISFILGILLLFNKSVDLSFIWQVLPFMGAILLWVSRALFRKKSITRRDGYLFLLVFCAYIGWNVYSHFSIVG